MKKSKKRDPDFLLPMAPCAPVPLWDEIWNKVNAYDARRRFSRPVCSCLFNVFPAALSHPLTNFIWSVNILIARQIRDWKNPQLPDKHIRKIAWEPGKTRPRRDAPFLTGMENRAQNIHSGQFYLGRRPLQALLCLNRPIAIKPGRVKAYVCDYLFQC